MMSKPSAKLRFCYFKEISTTKIVPNPTPHVPCIPGVPMSLSGFRPGYPSRTLYTGGSYVTLGISSRVSLTRLPTFLIILYQWTLSWNLKQPRLSRLCREMFVYPLSFHDSWSIVSQTNKTMISRPIRCHYRSWSSKSTTNGRFCTCLKMHSDTGR